MTHPRDIHMVSFSRMFFDENSAREAAWKMGIKVEPVISVMAINFIAAPRHWFGELWLEKREGYCIRRGKRKRAKGSDVRYKSDGEVGTYPPQTEKAIQG